MIQREIILTWLKIIALFVCVLFRVLLGRDSIESNNEAELNQKDSKVFEKDKLIKDITLEFISSESTVVCGID